MKRIPRWFFLLAWMPIFWVVPTGSLAWAEENDVLIALTVARQEQLTALQTRLLLAIRAQENGRSGREYGVLVVSAPTQEVQARITARTIKRNWQRWKVAGQSGDPVEWMAQRWAPIGAENDPHGLNRYWLRNVRAFLSVLGSHD